VICRRCKLVSAASRAHGIECPSMPEVSPAREALALSVPEALAEVVNLCLADRLHLVAVVANTAVGIEGAVGDWRNRFGTWAEHKTQGSVSCSACSTYYHVPVVSVMQHVTCNGAPYTEMVAVVDPTAHTGCWACIEVETAFTMLLSLSATHMRACRC
jgi:hypothetical protein